VVESVTRRRRKKADRPWPLAKHEGWTTWHYVRETNRLLRQAEITLGSVIDSHSTTIATMPGPKAPGSEGRSARRKYFKAVLFAQLASLVARRGPLVRELLELERTAGQSLGTDADGHPMYRTLRVER
jgi:hypothetical protein